MESLKREFTTTHTLDLEDIPHWLWCEVAREVVHDLSFLVTHKGQLEISATEDYESPWNGCSSKLFISDIIKEIIRIYTGPDTIEEIRENRDTRKGYLETYANLYADLKQAEKYVEEVVRQLAIPEEELSTGNKKGEP